MCRARVDGGVFDLENLPELNPRRVHHIDAVVDRVIIRAGVRARVGESVRLAVNHGEGMVIVCYLTPEMEPEGGGPAEWNNELFSTQYACPDCNISYEELEPRTFSFNSPYGACPVCEGLGAVEEFDPELVLPNPELSIEQDAIDPWKGIGAATQKKQLKLLEPSSSRTAPACRHRSRTSSPRSCTQLFHGDEHKFLGVVMLLEKEYSTTTRKNRLAALETYRGVVTCQACKGSRLRPEATSVRLAGKGIHEITALSVDAGTQFLRGLVVSRSAAGCRAAAAAGNPQPPEVPRTRSASAT